MDKPKRKWRFTFGELVVTFIMGAMVSAYALLVGMLWGKCVCETNTWGFASLGMWILTVTVSTLRGRDG
jgi:hypothetical protein